MKKLNLSVVLATFNEEKNIEACLNAVSDIAQEMIVVDGSSADKTREIAKSLGAKVIKTQNHPIFHINKNKAIAAATSEWILQLDADEIVSPALKDEIKKVVEDKDSKDGYWIPRKNYFLGTFLTKGGQYPDYTLRLYRNGKAKLPAKDVHEQAEVAGTIGYLKHDLMHYRDTSFSKYIDGLNRYTDLISTQIKDQGVSVNPISFINYLVVKPTWWFLWTYFRHRGYVDGFSGFVFCLFSALRFPIAYMKMWSREGK